MAKDWTSESYIYPEDCQRWENKAPSTSATISSDGLMSKEDKIKLNGISVGADKTPGLATNTTSGLMSGADKAKLGGIEAGANKYILPSTLPSTMITQDSTHRFVTDAEKAEIVKVKDKADKTYVDGELNKKYNKEQVYTKEEVMQKVKELIGTAPEALDTLGKLADALDNDPNFATTVINLLADKVDVVDGKGLSDENYSLGEKNKLTGVEAGANKYIHPATHSANIIVENTNRRFVTDLEKTSWNSKSTLLLGETSTTAYRGDRGKIAYDHSQVAHAPANAQKNMPIATSSQASSGTSNDVVMTPLRTKESIENLRPYASKDEAESGVNNSKIMTPLRVKEAILKLTPPIPGKATTTTDGLMSKEDKTKLDGVASGANNYTHPVNHPPEIISQNTTNRFVTDVEKARWDGKSNLALGTTSTTAFRGDQGKVAYDHSQLAHAPSDAQKNRPLATKEQAEAGIDTTTSMTPLRTKEAILKLAPIPGLATNTTDGLMSKEDFSKLYGIEAGAQKNDMIVVTHGSTASTTRPAGAKVVYWIGTVEPTNATDNDMWVGGE